MSAIVFGVDARAAAPKAGLLIIHGLAEYAGRYRSIADEFAARGISCVAFDQAGHGSRPGARTHIERFEDFIDEASNAVTQFAPRNPALPLFIWGHSMGSIVALRLAKRDPRKIAGLVLSSNSLEVFRRGLNPLNPFFRFAARVAPTIRIPLGLDATKISRDESVQRAYASDPLIPSTASLRLIVEFAAACEFARGDASEIRLPTLILHGAEDAIAPAHGSQVLFDTIGTTDKTLKLFPQLRHEVHNERQADRALFIDAVASWVLKRV